MSNSRMEQFLHLLPYLVVYVVDRCVHVAHTKHTHGFLSTTCLVEFWSMFFTVGRSFTSCSWFLTALDQSKNNWYSFTRSVATETTADIVFCSSCCYGNNTSCVTESIGYLADWMFSVWVRGREGMIWHHVVKLLERHITRWLYQGTSSVHIVLILCYIYKYLLTLTNAQSVPALN